MGERSSPTFNQITIMNHLDKRGGYGETTFPQLKEGAMGELRSPRISVTV
jgi:hypothetical protein